MQAALDQAKSLMQSKFTPSPPIFAIGGQKSLAQCTSHHEGSRFTADSEFTHFRQALTEVGGALEGAVQLCKSAMGVAFKVLPETLFTAGVHITQLTPECCLLLCVDCAAVLVPDMRLKAYREICSKPALALIFHASQSCLLLRLQSCH